MGIISSRLELEKDRDKYLDALKDIYYIIDNNNTSNCEYCFGSLRQDILNALSEVIGDKNEY